MENKKYKKVSFPKFVVGNLPLLRLLVKEEKQPYFIQKVEDPRQKPSGMTPNFMSGSRLTYNGNDAFTLIELLVVVLIIGLLAAVALPQYQKAVMRAQFVQLVAYNNAIVKAQKIYHMANGTYTTNLDELDIEIKHSSNANCSMTGNPTTSLWTNCWFRTSRGRVVLLQEVLQTGQYDCCTLQSTNYVGDPLCIAETKNKNYYMAGTTRCFTRH